MFKKIVITCLFLLVAGLVGAQNLPPKSNTLVTDSTNTLSTDEKAALESKLVAFDDSTTTQIAVVILKSVGQYDISQYGAALIRAWGIGTKDKNNGILILVALNDHKVTIQTGYGAEAAVPDIVTHDIIANDITPNFKQGKYYAGLDAATNSIMAHMKGEYKADTKAQGNSSDGAGAGGIVAIIIIVIVILVLIFRNRGGGGGHIIGRRGGASPFWWFLMGSALSNNGGGGFFGGGGSGSDNDSGGGGGFGGFGGGDSGGGGSSGSW